MYDPLPEDCLTPSGIVKLLKEREGVDMRPQVLYTHARNNKRFKDFCVSKHTDGRVLINIEGFFKWWDEKEARRNQ